MTEEDAQKKWCPFTRVVMQMPSGAVAPASGNRVSDTKDAGVPAGSQCIASSCMAWRMTRKELGISNGFCGLAGRPE